MPELPALPDGFTALLAKGVDGIATDAAGRVKRQIAAHGFNDDGEAWLAEGLKHATGESCPFCAGTLSENELIDAYRGYFSEAYAGHKMAIEEMVKALNAALSATSALKCEQAFKDADTDAAFWKGYCDNECHSPEAGARISAEVNALLQTGKALLQQKIEAPLDVVAESAEFIEAHATWAATLTELEAATAKFTDAKHLIQGVKDGLAVTNKATVETALNGFEAVQKRHAEPVLSIATAYQKLQDEKKALVDAKDTKKAALDAYDAEIIGAYETDINRILATLGAGFRLAQCGKNYVGKVPQSTYCLRFDTNDVDVTSNGGNDPGFDTTMSAGDKNAFALTFFYRTAQARSGPCPQACRVRRPFHQS
ncbi:AAA family ATPase [Agrobacterium sp. 22117]|uniref:AAA family ATPase n=1 Tax=Agrobacterium sp. 22117 TaxID=3453880 RepID=UPI003F84AAC3